MMSYRTRDAILWHRAPLPPIDHECEPWTAGYGGTVYERCACGASRVANGEWFDRNSRRLSLKDDVRFYAEDDWPWLTESNRQLKTPEGIAALAEMLDAQTNLAGVIIQSVGTEQARLNYDAQVEDALNERFMAESRETLRVAAEAGAAHLIVRRGYRDHVTTRAHVVDGVAFIITDLPESISVDSDGRCLP